jgi:hypothetical protein
MSHYFFTFYPTYEQNPKHGRATHYPPKQGIITLDEPIAQHIVNCLRYGKRPQLFSQGWLDRKRNTFNVGFEVPRDSLVPSLYEQEQSIARNNLSVLFDS